jgi:protein-disulfide isomerase
LIAVRPFRILVFALTLAALGCHAQVPAIAGGGKLSPELMRRVQVLIRSRSGVPGNYDITVGPRTKSEVAGFDAISVTFSSDGKTSKPVTFLLSDDGKTLAQFTKFDISKDPKDLVSATGRPGRGGPENAPVVVVGFDDLECPYCARMHAELFPALTERYKNQVRIVYKDFPLVEIHPWAMRAAIDVECMAAQSPTGYWNLVDYIHAHAAEMGGAEKSVANANATLDSLTKAEGTRQNANSSVLNACIAKQDETAVRASMKEGEDLGVDSTPMLFVNGEKVSGGALPMKYIYKIIDDTLIASGQTPPPPPPDVPVQANQTSPATKPGN